jgi:hypothetical protein
MGSSKAGTWQFIPQMCDSRSPAIRGMAVDLQEQQRAKHRPGQRRPATDAARTNEMPS